MDNENYIVFEILGVKHTGRNNSLLFKEEATCEPINDEYIKKILLSKDISSVTFYLNDNLNFTDKKIEIINYLCNYLGNMMISLIKYSSKYQNISLKPTICLSSIHIIKENINIMEFHDGITLNDSLSFQIILDNGNEVLNTWIKNINVSNYSNKQGKYDILFLLLQGHNPVQKYMAMYAYLMSLVAEIQSQGEKQKNVVTYVTNNCSKVGIQLCLSPSTNPNANHQEDQFTSLRNNIAHPNNAQNRKITVNDSDINGLASIICCAIEDIQS